MMQARAVSRAGDELDSAVATLATWWEHLDRTDVRVLHALGASEHAFKFNFALHAGRSWFADEGPKVAVEADGLKDVVVGAVSIQFKHNLAALCHTWDNPPHLKPRGVEQQELPRVRLEHRSRRESTGCGRRRGSRGHHVILQQARFGK